MRARDLKVEKNMKVIMARISANNSQDLETWESLHDRDVVRQAPELRRPLRGKVALRRALEDIISSFPDYHVKRTNAFGDGDWLCVEFKAKGGHRGPLRLGGHVIPPTNRAFENSWCAVFRFNKNKIAEVHEYYDLLGIMQQLGLPLDPARRADHES